MKVVLSVTIVAVLLQVAVSYDLEHLMRRMMALRQASGPCATVDADDQAAFGNFKAYLEDQNQLPNCKPPPPPARRRRGEDSDDSSDDQDEIDCLHSILFDGQTTICGVPDASCEPPNDVLEDIADLADDDKFSEAAAKLICLAPPPSAKRHFQALRQTPDPDCASLDASDYNALLDFKTYLDAESKLPSCQPPPPQAARRRGAGSDDSSGPNEHQEEIECLKALLYTGLSPADVCGPPAATCDAPDEVYEDILDFIEDGNDAAAAAALDCVAPPPASAAKREFMESVKKYAAEQLLKEYGL